MSKLTLNQRKALAEFCGNFAIAWLGAGLLPTITTGNINSDSIKSAILSTLIAIVLIIFMLKLTGGRKK